MKFPPHLLIPLCFVWLLQMPAEGAETPKAAVFRAGTALVNIDPPKFPVRVNAMFTERSGDKVVDPLHVRALALGDGKTTILFAVVDTCMMGRDLIDRAKEKAARETGIAASRMLVSATHTHSAPSALGCLGSRMDPEYAAYLEGKVAEALAAAHRTLRPARVGWTSVDDWDHTYNRRWIRRPDKMLDDPFGRKNVRANMHPGHQSPDAIGPSGPVDPALTLLGVVTPEGKPLALLANYSQHYYGSPLLSADYYGRFAAHFAALAGAAEDAALVPMMSQGTSGDLMWMDYGMPRKDIGYDAYAKEMAGRAHAAWKTIDFQDSAPLAMAERLLKLKFRQGDAERIAWAEKIKAGLGDKLPQSKAEIYALEALYLRDRPEAELKLQTIRIGDLAIAAIPNEVYAITGLKLKRQSPLPLTMNIELANGGEGYIPPPEQHRLGGYTTWNARTAGLEETAEPQIVETLLGALEEVSGQKRRALVDEHGAYAESILATKPAAFWRLNEMVPATARDASPQGIDAAYDWDRGVAFYLPGPGSGAGLSPEPKLTPSAFSGPNQINRAPHFAGGSLSAELPKLGQNYSVELWFWNGLPGNARPVAGYLFSRGKKGDRRAAGDHLGIGGTAEPGMADRLFFFNGDEANRLVIGKTPLALKQWHHVVLTREGGKVRAYLNGNAEAEFEGEAAWTLPDGVSSVFIGGRCDDFANFEGRIDEVSVYDRVLSAAEIAAHAKASGVAFPKAEIAGLASPPLGSADSLAKLHLPPGFHATLAATEPQVLDPVAFDWDTAGRLWVVEMADYPVGMDGAGKPGGRVRVLEDRDEAGRYETSTLFADGLNFPNGIITWRDGAIVTAAPEVIFLRDTDGDGRMDEKELLISGLTTGNEQLRANGLRWGLDNWVYVAAGGHHGKYGVDTKLTSHRAKQEVAVGSRDFRFRPDTGALEPASGPTQFGRNRDDWGRWFGTQNSNPLWHYVLPDHYLSRNPYYGAPHTLVQLLSPPNPPVFPASELEKRFHSFDQSGRFTSACAGMVVRDARSFGDGGLHAMVCEPFHNVIQHLSLRDEGVTFAAERVSGEYDFFASADRWCRPVMVREGPDGALWVADMYRYMIEHPHWLPEAGRAELLPHYRAGDDKGRLYRVARDGQKTGKIPRLDKLPTAELVAALGDPNGWVRDKAHLLLLWKGDTATAVEPLKKLAADSPEPLARLHALCVLDGLDALPPDLVAHALGDATPGVRENALRLAESRFTPEVLAAAVKLTGDDDPKVRLQLAFSLGASKDPAAGEALARLLKKEAGDPMMFAAAMSSAVPHLAILAANSPAPESQPALLGTALGLGDRTALARLFEPVFTGGKMAEFSALLDTLARQNTSIEKLRAGASDDLTRLLDKAGAFLDTAEETAANTARSPKERIAAASLLARDSKRRPAAIDSLAAWLDPKQSADIHRPAIEALAATGSDQVPGLLAAAWPALSPASRAVALDAWLGREPWTADLIKRVEKKEIGAAALDPAQRDRLVQHNTKAIREAAARLFAGSVSANRAEVVKRYAPSLKLTGDAAKGAATYRAVCAACHRRGQEGRDLGPDLASVAGHPAEKLLGSILDPNGDIQPGYQGYTVTIAGGGQLYGLIASESANSLTFKLIDGTERVILREQIAELRGANLSLMPEGLEAAIDAQQMADLIAFLRGPIGK